MASRMVQNMSDEEYFDNLNYILEEFVTGESTKEYLSLLDGMEQVAMIIVEHHEIYDLDNMTYNEHVDINDSILIVRVFCDYINPNYHEHFQNIFEDKSKENQENETEKKIEFIELPPSLYNSNGGIKNDGKIDIMYHNGINDAYVLVHELFHTFQDLDRPSGMYAEDYLCEMVPITIEFLFQDYLNNVGFNNSEINNYVKQRIQKEYIQALRLLHEKQLVDLYLKRKSENKKISPGESLIDEFKIDKDSIVYQMLKKYGEEFTDGVVARKKINIPLFERYALGLIIACQFHERIISNPKEIDTFINLNHSIGNKDSKLLEVLKDYGLDFFSITPSGQAVINEETMYKFRSSFISEVFCIK